MPHAKTIIVTGCSSGIGLASARMMTSRGWRVFPLADRDKVPRPGSRGFKDATCDREQIARWWAEHPHANIGIATGGGLLVVDVDGDEGRASIQGKHLPPTVCAMTARGCHYFFAGDGRCMTGLLPGIDIRGAGGYVVAAPSVHPTGAAYCWAPGLSPDDLPLAPAPDWLTEAATPTPARRTGARLPEAVPCPMAERCEVSTAYGLAALRNVTRELAAAPVGTRNARLTAAALRSGNLIGGGELTWADVWRELWAACDANGLLTDPADGPEKTENTLRRNLTLGMAHPCGPPNVLIDRRLLNARLKLSEGGLRYACLLALFGNLKPGAMAEQAGVSPKTIGRWRKAFARADEAAGGRLMEYAMTTPTGKFARAPVGLVLNPDLPLTLALHLRALPHRHGVVLVGREKLTALTGLPLRTMAEHVAKLRAAGWLAVSQSAYCAAKGRRLGVNRYALRDRPTPAAQDLPATKRTDMAHRLAATPAPTPAAGDNSPKTDRFGTSVKTSRLLVNTEGLGPLPGRSKQTTTTDAESVAVGRSETKKTGVGPSRPVPASPSLASKDSGGSESRSAVGRSTHQDQPPGRPSAVSLAVGRRPVRHTNDTVHTANAPDPTSPVQHSEWHEPTDEEHAANLAALPEDILAQLLREMENSKRAMERPDMLPLRESMERHCPDPEVRWRRTVRIWCELAERRGPNEVREALGLPAVVDKPAQACDDGVWPLTEAQAGGEAQAISGISEVTKSAPLTGDLTGCAGPGSGAVAGRGDML